MASALAARENHDRPWLTAPEQFLDEHLSALKCDEAVFRHIELTVEELREVLCTPVQALPNLNIGRLTSKTDDRLRLLSAAEHSTKENPTGLLQTFNERFLALQKRHHVERKSMHGMPHNHSPLSPLSRFSLQDDRVPLTPEDVAGIQEWAGFFHVKMELVVEEESARRRMISIPRLLPGLKGRLARLNIF